MNTILPTLTGGILDGLRTYQEIESNKQRSQLQRDQFEYQKESDARDFGLRQSQSDIQNKELGLRLSSDKRAQDEFDYENSPDQRALKDREKNADITYKSNQGAYMASQTAEMQRKAKQEVASQAALAKFMATIKTAQDPEAQAIYSKVSSGQPLSPEENAKATQLMLLPDAASRVGQVHPATDLVSNTTFRQQLEQIGKLDGDTLVVTNNNGPKRNGKASTAETRIPLSELNFKVTGIPKTTPVRDPKTGNISFVMDLPVTSDKLPGKTIVYKAPATLGKTSGGSDPVVSLTPEQYQEKVKDRLNQFGEFGSVVAAGKKQGMSDEELANIFVTHPEVMKQFATKDTTDNQYAQRVNDRIRALTPHGSDVDPTTIDYDSIRNKAVEQVNAELGRSPAPTAATQQPKVIKFEDLPK